MSGAADAVIQRAQARVGITLRGKWRIDSLLGVGGMAAVYAATHRNNNRVAIKMLHPELSIHADIRARFLREGYVANTVGHPGAVTVLDDDTTEDGAAFLVMELLEGDTVVDRLERGGGRLPVGEVLSIADQLLDVLIAAHAKGIVHRDIKPDNLLLDGQGRLKVLDFGIARLREGGGQSDTRTGAMLGTPAFMPPEQARGLWSEVDARSDLWAVGATMFTLLGGGTVHRAQTANEALALAITEHARSLAAVLPDAPPALVRVVDRALAYEKQERFPDAAAMQAAVRELYGALDGAETLGGPSVWSRPEPSNPSTEFVHAVTEASRPDASSAPLEPPAKLSSHTTTRGVESSRQDRPARSSKRAPILLALGIGAVGLVVAVVLLLRGGGKAPTATSASAASVAPDSQSVQAAVTPPPSALPSASAAKTPVVAPQNPDSAAVKPASPAQSHASKAAPARPRKAQKLAPKPTRTAPTPRPANTDNLGGRL